MELKRELGFRVPTLSLLLNRGIRTPQAARRFLNPSSHDLIDPMRLKEMDLAVFRIREAIRRSDRVVVYGDYDVDGVTATALYLDYFRSQGLEAGYYIPHRVKEGYGLHEAAIRSLHRQGIRLLITADCGTASANEIRLARSLGMDVIVTDHHEVQGDLPPATALLNPKRPDSGYPEKGLCTAGLAYKVIQACREETSRDGLDLVALGTIADVSPLIGENRFMVKEGLEQLSAAKRPGIWALKEAAGLKNPIVKPGTVGFALAPRINAAGRLTKADEGLRLLLTTSPAEARSLAESLNRQNRERQQVEQGILEEACQRVESDMDVKQSGGIVLASRTWHLGVVGIVAARLAEKYNRPTILLAIDSDGMAKGSARSIAGFHLVEGLHRCRKFLVRYGGHEAAAGLVLPEDLIPAFRERFSESVFEKLRKEDFLPVQRVDASVGWEDLDLGLVSELERLAPFGVGNAEPTLLLERAVPVGARIVGQNHLKFRARRSRGPAAILDVIGFRMGERLGEFRMGAEMDLVFTPERNTWRGLEILQLRLKDFRTSRREAITRVTTSETPTS